MSTFADKLRSGDACQDDINDWIDAWHEAEGKPTSCGGQEITLREYLGLTEAQYGRWLTAGDEVLDEIMDGSA